MAKRRVRAASAVTAIGVLLVGAIVLASGGLRAAGQRSESEIIQAIREEGFARSQAMETVSWLSDVFGPRVTGTPAIESAKDWTAERLRAWGLGVSEERFQYGRGWSLERFHAHLIEPQVMPIIGYPRAWTTSTNGTVTADVVRILIQSQDDVERYRGTLAGKIILMQPTRTVAMLEEDLVLRMDEALLDEATRPVEGTSQQQGSGGTGARIEDYVNDFLLEEGIVALLDRGSDVSFVGGAPSGGQLVWPTQRTDGGTVFVGAGGSRAIDATPVVPTATVAVEHYNRMVRLLDQGVPVRVEINIQTRFHEEVRPNGFNLIGELPGTDLANEVVLLGAHFDSTHASTGATDNAAGVAAMMEALRILQAVKAQPRRTVRVVLWGGEEQGLLGSRAYVARHYGGSQSPTPEHASVAAYFNLDNGAGRIRGIWRQGNAAIEPVFREWMRDLADLEVTTVGRRSTRGTDHVSFDEVGLPGFQFMQDRLEYNSRTHHSNMDVYDRVQRDDLLQMSVVAAIFAYRAAMLGELPPRKELR